MDITYNVPVRKAWGKKNPEIQNTAGVPLSIHDYKNNILSLRSSIQEANGFKDKCPIGGVHFTGT